MFNINNALSTPDNHVVNERLLESGFKSNHYILIVFKLRLTVHNASCTDMDLTPGIYMHVYINLGRIEMDKANRNGALQDFTSATYNQN